MTSESGPVHLADVRGTRIAWTADGDGPTAVWAHGLTSSSCGHERSGMFDWTPLTLEHRLLRYDARGHGRSSGTPEPDLYTWPQLGQDLLALLSEVAGDEQVDGIGASMGTATLLHAAATDQGRFRRLVLTTPPTMGAVRAHHVRGYLDGAALVERAGLAAYERACAVGPPPHVHSGLVTEPPAIEVTETLLPSVLRGAALSDLPDDTTLAGLDLPVMVLAWSGDAGHPLSTARHLTTVIPGARLLIADTPMQVRDWPGVVADFLR